MTGQHRIQIHLRQHPAPIRDLATGHNLQPLDKRLGGPPTVRLDEPDHTVDALLEPSMTFQQHLVGLANPRSGAQIDTEPSPRHQPALVRRRHMPTSVNR